MAAWALVPRGEAGARAHPTERYGRGWVPVWARMRGTRGRSWESMNPYMGSMAPDPGPKILMPGIDDIIGNGPNCLLAVSMALAPSARVVPKLCTGYCIFVFMSPCLKPPVNGVSGKCEYSDWQTATPPNFPECANRLQQAFYRGKQAPTGFNRLQQAPTALLLLCVCLAFA